MLSRVYCCPESKKTTATRHPEGFCAHTAVAILRCAQDGSIEIS